MSKSGDSRPFGVGCVGISLLMERKKDEDEMLRLNWEESKGVGEEKERRPNPR